MLSAFVAQRQRAALIRESAEVYAFFCGLGCRPRGVFSNTSALRNVGARRPFRLCDPLFRSALAWKPDDKESDAHDQPNG